MITFCWQEYDDTTKKGHKALHAAIIERIVEGANGDTDDFYGSARKIADWLGVEEDISAEGLRVEDDVSAEILLPHIEDILNTGYVACVWRLWPRKIA